MGIRALIAISLLGSGLALIPGSADAVPAVVVDRPSHSALLRFGRGRQVLTFHMNESSGVILLYRITAPAGLSLRGSAQLASITVPLWIETTPPGPSSSCALRERRLTCTVGEEWCPMPEGTWVFRVEKLGGPGGDATLQFRISAPPGTSAT